MDAQAEAETTSSCPTVVLSEDSDDETSQDEAPPVPKWNELTIVERVGLQSVEMSERDLEAAFSQISMAFHCDQYTLKQRLQAEEHGRDLAEENVQLELSRGRETLETLKGLCMDSKRSRILQRLELSLDILAGTVERISNTAEVLGAVHQEARVSRAVQLMVAHVENLRRQHDKNLADLEEAKKLIQQQSTVSPRACSDPEDSDSRMRSFQQTSSRRRVSVSLISRESQEVKRHLKKQESTKKSGRSGSPSSESSCSLVTREEDGCLLEDRPANPDEPSSAPPPPEHPSIPESECLRPKHPAGRVMQRKNSPPLCVRQRHKSTASLSKKKADKDKRSKDACCTLSPGRRPLARWLDCCRWMLLFIYMFVLFCVITLTFFLLEL